MIDPTLLASLPLFKGLSTVELEEVATYLDERRAKPEEKIISEGDAPGHPIYVLLKGSVEVLKSGLNGRLHVISSLSAPSVFGEVEVIARRPAIASVVASTDVELATLQRGIYDQLGDQSRPAILKVVRNLALTLASRLAATDERLAAYFDLRNVNERERLNDVRKLLYSSWRDAE